MLSRRKPGQKKALAGWSLLLVMVKRRMVFLLMAAGETIVVGMAGGFSVGQGWRAGRRGRCARGRDRSRYPCPSDPLAGWCGRGRRSDVWRARRELSAGVAVIGRDTGGYRMTAAAASKATDPEEERLEGKTLGIAFNSSFFKGKVNNYICSHGKPTEVKERTGVRPGQT